MLIYAPSFTEPRRKKDYRTEAVAEDIIYGVDQGIRRFEVRLGKDSDSYQSNILSKEADDIAQQVFGIANTGGYEPIEVVPTHQSDGNTIYLLFKYGSTDGRFYQGVDTESKYVMNRKLKFSLP